MLRLLKKQPSREEVFMERYSSMKTWAGSLTKGDAELTEEIIQDAYIQFTLNAPPLDEIQNLDGYLYVLLKNLCLANLRRSGRNRLNQLSIYEYDSAEFAFSRLDFRDQENARDELQRICSFLSVRKNHTRTASIFILRFFHGYFPSEVAQILRTSRPAIDVRLLEARKEIKAFLDNPKDVKFIGVDDSAKEVFQVLPVQNSISQDEFLHQLRAVIFRFRSGEHQSKEELREFYDLELVPPIKVDRLSHLVSCPQCLDEVNVKLKLPKLSSRFPTDAINRDKKKVDGSDDNDNSSGGTKGGDMLTKLERHARLIFEHKPKELRVAVNGNYQSTLKVNSDLNEIDLVVANKEPVEFIEIYSEQQVRLLFLTIDNSLPHPTSYSTYILNFSDQRTLQIIVGFAAQGVEIKLQYQDPTYKQVQLFLENPQMLNGGSSPILEREPRTPNPSSISNRLLEYFSNLTYLFSFGWRKVAFVALIIVIAVGGLMLSDHQSGLSAKAILEEAEIKKLNWQYQRDKILYWEEEEKLQNSSQTYRSKRWANNLNGQHEKLILRYDEQNQLSWGKWVKADGTMITYNGKANSMVIYPGIPLIKEKLVGLSEEEKHVLQKHLVSSERNIDSEQQAQINTEWMINNYSSELVSTHEVEGGKKVIRVFIKANKETPDSRVKASEWEANYDEKTLQRMSYRLTFFLKNGDSVSEEARLLTSREATLEEFQNNELTRILAEGKKVKYLSVEEFAERLRPIYLPNKK